MDEGTKTRGPSRPGGTEGTRWGWGVRDGGQNRIRPKGRMRGDASQTGCLAVASFLRTASSPRLGHRGIPSLCCRQRPRVAARARGEGGTGTFSRRQAYGNKQVLGAYKNKGCGTYV